jgi:hypothetical protein
MIVESARILATDRAPAAINMRNVTRALVARLERLAETMDNKLAVVMVTDNSKSTPVRPEPADYMDLPPLFLDMQVILNTMNQHLSRIEDIVNRVDLY